ncbi:hypothetical protein [Candidatus Leptofilum sp.]
MKSITFSHFKLKQVGNRGTAVQFPSIILLPSLNRKLIFEGDFMRHGAPP